MCDGYYGADSIYHALHLGNPPVETREQSMLYCGGVDFFGAGKETTEEQVGDMWMRVRCAQPAVSFVRVVSPGSGAETTAASRDGSPG